MKFGRYKNWTEESWSKALERAKRHRHIDLPNVMLAYEAELVLEAYHRGPWRMIWNLTKREADAVWMWYGWPKWEWIRTRVFRRPQDEVLAQAERVSEEMDAVDELCKML